MKLAAPKLGAVLVEEYAASVHGAAMPLALVGSAAILIKHDALALKLELFEGPTVEYQGPKWVPHDVLVGQEKLVPTTVRFSS